jgi:cytoskeletal protein CcmA (bactofilin family)
MTVNFRGYLFKDNGEPLEGAPVHLLETGTTTVEATTTTDSTGLWYFTEADQDRYDIKITSGTSARYIRWDDQISLKEIDVRNNTGATTPAATFTNLTNSTSNQVAIFRGANSTRANNDEIYLSFELADSGGALDEFARITAVATDVTAGSEDGALIFYVADTDSSGDLQEAFRIASSTGGTVSQTFTTDSVTFGTGGDTDVVINFNANSADGVLTWMEDEDYFKFSDDILMNSTERLNFYDTAIYIYSSTDGQLDLVADTEIQIAATTIDINGAVALNGAITGATNITLSGELDAATLDISGNADIDGTANLDVVDIDGAVQIDATFTSGVDGQGYDTKFFGDTSGAYILWDTSADKLLTAGGAVVDIVKDKFLIGGTAVTTTAAELNVLDAVTAGTVTASLGVVVDSSKDIGSFRNITLTGELDGGSLDISGDADIDGTTNLDAVDIDGNVQIDGTVTVGVDDTGLDVKFFGATSGQYLLWDESADELVLAGDTKLSFHDAAGGENIIASSNGHLEVNAGTTLDITAPTVDLNSSTEFNIDTAAYDLNASGAVTIDSAGISLDSSAASNLTTSGGALTITSAAAATWSTAASALTINGTGGLNLQEGGATIVSISDARVLATSNTASVDLDASGAIQINSSGGAISIGNDNIDQTVNLATAGTRTLNIGIDDNTDLTTINVNGNMILKGVTPVLTIGDGDAEDAGVVFDGTVPYHFALDDTHDGIFLGSTASVGSNIVQGWKVDGSVGPLIAFGSTPSTSFPFKVYMANARDTAGGLLQWFSSTMTTSYEGGSPGTHIGMHIDNTLVMNDDDAKVANVYQLRVDGAQITQPTPPADPGIVSGNTAAIYVPSAYSGTVGGTNYALLIAGGLSSFGGDINVTGSRVSHIYATNITSTNSVTVDSWSKAKENIISYTADALAKINDIDVVTYAHQKWLDPTGRTKLGVRAESIGEPLVTPESDYGELGLGPAVDSMGLSALTVRAIQMLTDRIEALETRLATV